MKSTYLFALVAAFSSLVNAEQLFEPSTYYLKGGINGSVLGENKKDSEAMGYETMLGVQFENGIFIEGGYQSFDLLRDDDIKLDAFSARLNWKYPVSDYAAVYVGGGASLIDSDFNPSAQLGIQYQLSRNWVADVSYQSIFDIEQVDDNLYSLNLSLVYRFPSSQPVVVDETPTIVAPAEPPVTVTSPTICKMEKRSYILVKGDFLIKVADTYEMSLAQLMYLNPQLNGRDINLVYPGESVKVSSREVCK